MLADPQSITIDSAAISLPRVLTGTEVGSFVGPNTELTVASTAKNGRVRTVARLNQSKVTTDPLVGSTNIFVNDSVALTINRPVSGYSDAEVLAQVKGFIAWLTASTDANLKKIIAKEN